MTENEAKTILTPLFGDLSESVHAAWMHCWATITESEHELSKRSRANIMYDNLRGETGSRFSDHPLVRVVDLPQNGFLAICDRILLRFNKLGADLSRSFNPTQLTFEFYEQEQMFGCAGNANLQLGYILNEPGTAVSHAVISHPSSAGGGVNWSFELPGFGCDRVIVLPNADQGDPGSRVVATPKLPGIPDVEQSGS